MALTTIKAAAMAANSVDSDQYVDGSIDTAHIGDDQVTTDKLADNIDIAGTLDVTGVATFDTTSTFTGDVTGNGGFTGKRTNNAWHVFRGQNSSGTQTSLITGEGYATFSGHTQIGLEAWNGANDGIKLYTNGSMACSVDSSYGYGMWTGYTTGNSTPTSKIMANGDATFATVTDSKGNVRNIPASTNTTLVAADAGKHISITAGITINASTDFAIGDAVTIFNNQAAGNDETITATGVTLYLATDPSASGNRTLAPRGLCTILCVAADTYVITGAGLS